MKFFFLHLLLVVKHDYDYAIIQLQILSNQSREFNKFFWASNCCSYKTHGFHKIFAFRENILAFPRDFRILHFPKKNVREMWPKIFAFFRETFRSLETLIFCIISNHIDCISKITNNLFEIGNKMLGMYALQISITYCL